MKNNGIRTLGKKGGNNYALHTQTTKAETTIVSVKTQQIRLASGKPRRLQNRKSDVICIKPFRLGVLEYGCGQCMPCRINKSHQWVGRMLMESMEHQANCFLTLTFDDQHIPDKGHLEKKPLQDFLKRLRAKFHPLKIRYFAVGEYGDQTWRPHYHVILFGVSPMEHLVIQSCWKFGFIQTGTAESASMQYITGYVLKKLTNEKNKLLKGRTPEFATMSKKPGIGHGVVNRLKIAIETAAIESVPELTQIRVHGKKYPLGRYLREKTMVALGITEDQKETLRIASMCATAERKDLYPSTEAYESERKARVHQQNYHRKVRTL